MRSKLFVTIPKHDDCVCAAVLKARQHILGLSCARIHCTADASLRAPPWPGPAVLSPCFRLFPAISAAFPAHLKNVACVTWSLRAASRPLIRFSFHISYTPGNYQGIGFQGRPKRTPRSLAAAIPSAWRWRIFSRSFCAT